MKQLFIKSVRDSDTNTMGKITLENVPIPEPEEDEIRIKVAYSSFCGSDVHTLTGDLGEFEEGTKSRLPMPFGHELSGVIDKVGRKALELGYKKGDKVVANYAKYCYSCDMCRSGKENFCSNLKFCMGGMAQYACYHVTQVHKLPADYDLLSACMIEPLTIALAVAEEAEFSFGKSVAIMGAGGIGLMLVQLARMSGASVVTVFDLIKEKQELALELGADYALDSRDEGVIEKAIEYASGKYDCVIEGTGSMSAAKMALDMLTRDGRGVYYAMYGSSPILGVNLHKDFYWDQKHLSGVIMGAGLFPKALKIARRMDLKSIVQSVHPLEEHEKAYADLLSKQFARVVIKMY
ncbi:MAG TPA: alcohol dehydrogenase catalytic domain-containing protein [Thermoclostridium sp.]|nr:alcohol dehydrogenase catalytic domain-containing protein [Thermoclostridium sp.]